jgi:hypothetical protein
MGSDSKNRHGSILRSNIQTAIQASEFGYEEPMIDSNPISFIGFGFIPLNPYCFT